MGQEEQRTFLLYGRVGLLISLLIVTLGITCNKKPPTSDDNNPPPQEYDPRNISRTETQSVGPSIAVGPDGTVYVAWMDGSETGYEPFQICFRYKPPGGDWSEIEVLTDTTEDAWAPQIAVDPSGNLHLVWDSRLPSHTVAHSEIHYRMRSPSGEWSDVTVLSNTGTATQSRIAVDPSGTVHVVWIQGFGMKYRQKISNGEWSEIETVPVGSTGSDNPYICSDHEGGLHVVYEGGEDDIKYLYRSPTGEWSEPVNVSESRWIPSVYAGVTPYGHDSVLVSWVEVNGDFTIGRAIGYYVFISDTNISPLDSLPYRGEVSHLRFLWNQGVLFGFFIDAVLDGKIKIYQKDSGGWILIDEISAEGYGGWPPYTYDAAVDPHGNIHIVWSQSVGGDFDHNAEIFYEVIRP